MAKVIMVQGTMSNAGKSLLCAGLCRIFKQDGYRVAPFKSQNMALNSYITADGLEMGRAQAVQAMAAGIAPEVSMNPILLKPTNDVGSQIIVNGKVLGDMSAKEYFAHKKKLIPDILAAYEKLAAQNDIIVIEGAGSPAEINLKSDDIVNMGMAELVDSPVFLAGDIDRGGVFAQLYGTVKLLEEKERRRIKGFIINKFRGDVSLLESGLKMLEDKCGIKTVGVVPYMKVDIEDEDSLTERFDNNNGEALIDIAVIKLPRISNFTDFFVFESMDNVNLRYVNRVDGLKTPDLIILPGTKNTIGDLKWLKETGFDAAIKKLHFDSDVPVFGICGGYQMLGKSIEDTVNAEEGGMILGLGLLPIATVFCDKKITKKTVGVVNNIDGIFASLKALKYSGYEIHMGRSEALNELSTDMLSTKGGKSVADGFDGMSHNNVYGTYIHGFFDQKDIASAIVKTLAIKKGIDLKLNENVSIDEYRSRQFDILADELRKSLDMDYIYETIGL